MSNAASNHKAALRRTLRAEMARHSAVERAEASAQLCARFRNQTVWQRAQAILFFAPLADEPDVRPLMSEALVAGKAVALPRSAPEANHYEICQITDPESDLKPGRFGIPEPLRSCPAAEAKRLDLVLVPGLGFSLAGRRLGRGKGFYDRLLAVVPGFKCGVAFDWQLTIDVPVEPHDIRLDGILTPLLWLEVASQSRS